MLFTIYHLFSTYINDVVPRTSNPVSFLLFDSNVLACLILFVLENTRFEDWFIEKMNKFIFSVVIITLIVSVIQIKDITFFIAPSVISNENSAYFLENGRNYSIYSWVNLVSIGITFPILISILINEYDRNKVAFVVVVFSAIIVSFLTRTRFVMISAILVLSQLLFSSKFALRKKITYIAIIVVSLIVLVGVSSSFGVDIQKIVDERILEKGVDLKESSSSAGARITSLNVFIAKFPEHPWFGVGPKTRDDVLALLDGIPLIHVGYLSYLYFYGIAGCCLLFFSLFFLLKDAWVVGKQHKFWGSFYGLLAFCFANLTFVYFDMSESGIIIAAIYIKFYKSQVSENAEQPELDSLVSY
jgi:O-antigen ligase